MQLIDISVLNFFVENRTEWLSFLALIITYMGGVMIVSSITFLSAISFYIHKYSARILPFLIAVGGSAAITYVLKQIFYRARPLSEALYLETGSSFPSAHATAAMALYGFLLYIIWRHDKHYLKNLFISFLGILIVLVGVSRLYLGVHYLSDVLAGYMIGFIWILISLEGIKLKLWRLRDNGRL